MVPGTTGTSELVPGSPLLKKGNRNRSPELVPEAKTLRKTPCGSRNREPVATGWFPPLGNQFPQFPVVPGTTHVSGNQLATPPMAANALRDFDAPDLGRDTGSSAAISEVAMLDSWDAVIACRGNVVRIGIARPETVVRYLTRVTPLADYAVQYYRDGWHRVTAEDFLMRVAPEARRRARALRVVK